jgi:hypothetical protein
MHDLPNELLLEIFPHFTLKSLIAGQGVCRKWRQLIPLSDILPTRRAFLELYLRVISSPIFPQTRKWTLANLREFNRQEYIDLLLKQHDYLPEAFRLWILEWPARAVFGCSWPGLPCEECYETEADGVDRLEGVNWLGHMPPQVSVMLRMYSAAGWGETQPGLLVWSLGGRFVWLLLDDEREGKGGRVYDLGDTVFVIRGVDGEGVDGNRVRYDEGEDGDDNDEDVPEETYVVYSSWIEWQRHIWREIERAASAAHRPKIGSDRPRIGFMQKKPGPHPMKAWTRRQEPGYLMNSN